jgi:SAM-dependent MidA family methyltransferase|tara:strand:- start:36 stop:1058 length:1023 start_codon:yes stop_codon:yes gene_type:complete
LSKDLTSFFKENYKNNNLYFDEYMDNCLYSKFGFFNTDVVRSSKEGDFLTSPEVSEYFGLIIANFINEKIKDGHILEVGAGTGSLAEEIVKNVDKKLYLLENSTTALANLKNKKFQAEEKPEQFSDKKIDIIYMNELLDNVPCSIGVHKDNKWYEKIIITNKEKFEYDLAEIREENYEWIKKYNLQPMEGVELEIQLNSEKLLNNFIDIFNPKYFLIFDYGYEYKDRDKKPYESLIRTYKEHHLSSEPLELPGETDITYDVNFTFVEKYFESKGYKVELMLQTNFLDKYGFENIYKKLKENYQKFSDIEKLKIKSQLVGLEAIHNERGLGGFYTLVAEKI